METIPTIQTRRLILTPLQLADAPAIQQLFPHWEVVRYLDSRVPWPYPEEGALTYVRDHALPAIAAGREWHWMIRLAKIRHIASAASACTINRATTEAFGWRLNGRERATCARPVRLSTPIGLKPWGVPSCKSPRRWAIMLRVKFRNTKACA